MLRDLGNLVPVLQALGTRHVGYNVIPAHYDVVGQALVKSLQTALGPHFTDPVKNAYLKVYTVVKTTMCGEHYKEAEASALEAAATSGETGVAAPETEKAPEAEKEAKTDEPKE